MAYATQPDAAPPIGGGTLALIDVFGATPGETTLTRSNVMLSDNGEPPVAFPLVVQNLSVVVTPEPANLTLVSLGLGAAGDGPCGPPAQRRGEGGAQDRAHALSAGRGMDRNRRRWPSRDPLGRAN